MELDLKGMPILELGYHESRVDIENRKGWKRINNIINGQEFNLLTRKSITNLDLLNVQKDFNSSQSSII